MSTSTNTRPQIYGDFSLCAGKRKVDLMALRRFISGTADKETAGRASLLIKDRIKHARLAGYNESQITEIVATTADTMSHYWLSSSMRLFKSFVLRMDPYRITLVPSQYLSYNTKKW